MVRLSTLLCLLTSSAIHGAALGFVAPQKSAPANVRISLISRRDIVPKANLLVAPMPRSSPTQQQRMLSSTTINPTKAASTSLAGRKRMAACMAFLAGCANIAIFTKFKTFATMLTGNTMWLALAVTEGNLTNAAYYLSVIFSYLLGTALFRRTDLSLRKQTLPVCAAIVATLFVLGDWVHFATTGRWIPMTLFAAAFGITNSLGSEVSGTLTFVVTGHLTRLVNQLVDRVSRTAGREKLTEDQRKVVILNSAIYGGFFAGCTFACMLSGFGLLHRFGVLSFIGLAHAGLWLGHDMEALNGAWWLREDDEMCDLDDDGETCELPVAEDKRVNRGAMNA